LPVKGSLTKADTTYSVTADLGGFAADKLVMNQKLEANALKVVANNGGYQVKPYLISKIVDVNGKVIEQSKPVLAGNGALRVIDGRNAFLMTSMMQDVVRIGTAAKARQLGRSDLAGKTGTTNNQVDAWFAGFNPKQVAIAWIGFDQPHTLGGTETGGQAALPIWIRYMSSALQGIPDKPYVVPDGVVSLKIDPNTGLHAADEASGVFEYFYQEYPPPEAEQTFSPIPGFPTSPAVPAAPAAKVGSPQELDQLF